MEPDQLAEQFADQRFANGYQLIDGVQMNAENGDRFQIPHPLLKKYIRADQFVELRIDSPRFSVHPDAPEQCTCPICEGEATKPILGHEHPATLLPLPLQQVPSRGWGEDFWVRVTDHRDQFFAGVVDNPLYEARLHELELGSQVVFHEDHVLAVHGSHREELVLAMEPEDLRAFIEWLGTLPE